MQMPPLASSEDEFQFPALKLAGCSVQTIQGTTKTTKDIWLRDFCCAGTKTLCDLHGDTQDDALGEFKIGNPNPTHLLNAPCFLKKYPAAHELCARCSNGTKKTVLNRTWKCLRAIQALKERKIEWPFDGENNECFILTVDGVHFRVQEPRTQPSSGWYSKKFNKAGLACEVGVAAHDSKIVWTNGPFPAGQNDIKIFRKELMSKIPDGCRATGDEGYRGEPLKVSTRNEFNSEDLNDFENRARARHETVNSRLKAFGTPNQVFRSKGSRRMPMHKVAFEACCVLVQYEMDNGGPLFRIQNSCGARSRHAVLLEHRN